MSTRCQPLWQVHLKPSRIQRGLIGITASISLLAVISTEANFWLEIGCAVSILLATIYQYRTTARLATLAHDSSEGLWRLKAAGKQAATGRLICAGYRSAYLVILVIQQEDTRYHYCTVWQDQISSSDFSYLHHQMLFNTSTPLRRHLKIMLWNHKGG